MTALMNDFVAGLYPDLHRLAARRLRGERSDHTLQATALVNEVYLKLCDQVPYRFTDETHFLATAARAMRQVLVDHARARATRKRGGENGDFRVVPFPTGFEVAGKEGSTPLDLLDIDRALDGLSREDETLAQIVEMYYFGGMTAEEIAKALAISVHVVRHDLRLAQAWLRREMSSRAAVA